MIFNTFKRRWMLIALSLFIALPVIERYPVTSYAITENPNSDKALPIYNSPVQNADIRRREGGEVGQTRGLTRSLTRGLSRGLTRGLSRGLTRGLSRGITRGLTRGLSRGENRGLTRGLTRGITRGLTRGLSRGENRGLTRGLSRGISRNLSRGLSRGLSRNLSRGLSRGLSRNLPRGLSRGLSRSFSRNLTRDLIRDASLTDVAAVNNVESQIAKFETDVVIPARMEPLAPEHTGLSSSSQPVLRWYVSGPWKDKIQFTLNETGAIEPLFETKLDGPTTEGICQINLADFHITLEPGKEYEWFIVIVSDPLERSADFLGSATIQYQKLPEPLKLQVEQTPAHLRHNQYAENGYWYDAVETISKQIDLKPDDPILRAHRETLLKQVNLPMAAEYDHRIVKR